jgi:mannose-6-phosphate isomerase class I
MIVKVRPDNLVERPWGGSRLLAHKGLPADASGRRFGEAFELAAYPDDEETRAHPSRVILADGSETTLLGVLEQRGEELLGRDYLARHGAVLPLLPKTLDVVELLSVQAHPAGNVEAYVIVDCDPGASIRLGFRERIDPAELAGALLDGRRQQEELGTLLRDPGDVARFGRELARCIHARHVDDGLLAHVHEGSAARAVELFHALARLYWRVLDLMTEVPVRPGQVIFNATPPRLRRTGQPLQAAPHALGNPDAREILLFEVRRPGPTLRAWDHVRFPLRPVDVERALAAMDFQPTTAADYEVTPQPVGAGIARSVEDAAFVVDHLRPAPLVELIPTGVQTLHALAGTVFVVADDADVELRRGESALVGRGCMVTIEAMPGPPPEVLRVLVAPGARQR